MMEKLGAHGDTLQRRTVCLGMRADATLGGEELTRKREVPA